SVAKGAGGGDGGRGRGESLRGGTAGERCGEGPADRGDGIEALELDGVGVASAPQRRSEEGDDRAGIEGENNHDLEVDRRGVVHGGLDASIELAIGSPQWEEVMTTSPGAKSKFVFVSKVWTDLFSVPLFSMPSSIV